VSPSRRSSRTIEVIYRFDPDHPPRRNPPRTPAAARQRLVAGNLAFSELLDSRGGSARVIPLDPRDVGHGAEPGVVPEQTPFAAVLGCSDARAPVEMIFQRQSNDLFVVRVAGNGVGSAPLGSLRYAASTFTRSLRLLVVLGHSQCGAVTAAVDALITPDSYLPLAANQPLRSIVDSILVAVRKAYLALEAAHGRGVVRRPGYRAALIETSVALNACLGAFALKRDLESRSRRVLFGCYDLTTRLVGLPLSPVDPRPQVGLFSPPAGDAELRGLAGRVAASARVLGLLEGPRRRARGRR
jgi:carbonic anhydrase